MRKYIPLLLALCLFLTAAGCGSNSSPAADAAAAESEPLPLATTQIAEAATQTVQDTPLPAFQKTATLEPTVLYDENNLKITATELSYNNYSAKLNILIENNSQKSMKFICESMAYSCNSVNDYMIEDGYLNCTVEPGKKANDSISFSIQELMLHGIYEISELEIGFDISDEDHNNIYTGPLHLQTSAFDQQKVKDTYYLDTLTNPGFMKEMEFSIPFTSQEVFYDENGIRILSACLLQNVDGEQVLIMEAENTTDDMIILSACNVSLNGLCTEPHRHTSLTMNPGKRGFLTISPDSAMEAPFRKRFGIEQIGSIGVQLEIHDTDWNLIAESDEIAVNISQETSVIDTSGTEVYNQDGLKIISKGIVEDSSEYSKNQHILLLAINDSEQPVKIDDIYDSVSVNGFMTDYYFHGQNLPAGKSGIVRIELTDASLEENKIESISEVEIGIDIGTDSEITLNIAY